MNLIYSEVAACKHRFAFWLALIAIAFALPGCSDSDRSIALKLATMETNVVEHVPWAKEFCVAFPLNEVTIATIVSTEPYKRNVQITAYAYDRYIVFLNYVVEFRSSQDLKVISFDSVNFRIDEVTAIANDNGITVLNFGQVFTFNTNDWKKFKDNQFDFAAIGISIKTNAPVPGFQAYSLQRTRKDW